MLVSRLGEDSDALTVAFACILVANAGLPPTEVALGDLVTKMSPAARAQARDQLQTTNWWNRDKAGIALRVAFLEPAGFLQFCHDVLSSCVSGFKAPLQKQQSS